jgi:hypothetical protein
MPGNRSFYKNICQRYKVHYALLGTPNLSPHPPQSIHLFLDTDQPSMHGGNGVQGLTACQSSSVVAMGAACPSADPMGAMGHML